MPLTAMPKFSPREGNAMYDVVTAKRIQEDRRHQADVQRIVSNLPRERSWSVGRYRLTVSRRSGSTLPAG